MPNNGVRYHFFSTPNDLGKWYLTPLFLIAHASVTNDDERMAELGERPPLTPGTSPFRAKGTTYSGHIQWVSETYPGGLPAYLKALDFDPQLVAFHSQKFLAPGWYDFMPLVCAGVTCAKAMNMGFEEFIAYRARNQPELDLRGVYKLLLAVTPNSFLARKLATVLARYFDFGEPVVIEEQVGHVVCEVRQVPQMFASWMRACFTGFLQTVLETGGAKAVVVTATSSAADEVKGYPGCTVRLDVRWK